MNPALSILGVLPTICHRGRQADEKALARLRDDAGPAGVAIFEPIPVATNYDKAADLQESVFKAYPTTPERDQYQAFARIIMSP